MTPKLGAAFAPNHKGMPLVPRDAEMDFFERQVLTSRNITGSWLKDNLMGGLNYQVEHHLFPNRDPFVCPMVADLRPRS